MTPVTNEMMKEIEGMLQASSKNRESIKEPRVNPATQKKDAELVVSKDAKAMPKRLNTPNTPRLRFQYQRFQPILCQRMATRNPPMEIGF
jgi:hypothetical protein